MSQPIDPPPIQPPSPAAPPPTEYGRGGPGEAAYLTHAVIALLIGCIFLMYGFPFGQWLMHPAGNPYHLVWDENGPKAGEVNYFELSGGDAWRDLGTFVTAVVLLVEAALYTLAMLMPRKAKRVITSVIVLGTIGIIANVLSAVMQIKMGFSQPLLAVVGAIVCVIAIASARQNRHISAISVQ